MRLIPFAGEFGLWVGASEAGDCLPGVAGGRISCSDMLAGVTAVGAVTVVTAPGSASDASVASVGESGDTNEPALPESAAPRC